MVRAENRSERRVAANIRTCACDSQLALATRIQKAMLRQRFLPSEVRGARRIGLELLPLDVAFANGRHRHRITRSQRENPNDAARFTIRAFSGADGPCDRGYTRSVCALPRRTPQTLDSVAEGSEFELSGDFENGHEATFNASSSRCRRFEFPPPAGGRQLRLRCEVSHGCVFLGFESEALAVLRSASRSIAPSMPRTE